ncbi:tetratricopeptide repeat protein, partial [Methylomagnum sp.]
AWAVAGALAWVVVLAVYLAATRSEGPAPAPAVSPQTSPSTPPPPPEFVGRAACAGCHAEQDRRWQGSHHHLAMQEAHEATVLGNFTEAEFNKDGVKSHFFRRDGRFWINTDGPDGTLADFEIKYTFGFTPLQQYLVALPGGRLQALSIAWDSRPKEQGGQRWFHLYPNEKIDHNDELHWTKLSQNWNYMCAECHSTNLQKNYDPASHGYRTTWSEIDVACEACHGPGSRHVAWAGSKDGNHQPDGGTLGLVFRLDERRGVHWTIDSETGNATRSRPRATAKEIEACARCHARRGQWFADYQSGQPLLDSHLPALLREGLYHSDGQIDGEVYEYGSFLQSRMHQAGVTCGDCHEPHSLKLRAEGGGVCLQCHAAGKYASTGHHHHREDSPGGRCVECHMPDKTYMGVDPRRDHSFRIPRPDLTARLGTPNACAHCHAKQPARWAADQLRLWFGHDPKSYQDYAEALSAARHDGGADAEAGLVALLRNQDQPAIARATAAAELGRWLSPASLPPLLEALDHADPSVRGAALQSLQPLPPEQRWRAAHRLLRDPVRVVRALAAEALAGIPVDQVPPEDQAALNQAGEEYLASLQFNADEPGAQVNLGNWYTAKGVADAAERAYREALKLDPGWVPAYVNLADIYRQTGRDTEGEAVLREGLARQPHAASLHHSLGLLEIRRLNPPAALASLKRAVELAPQDTALRYVYAVALDSSGRRREAEKVVETGLKQAPGDRALSQLRSIWKGAGQHR